MSKWVLATRPWSIPASLMPALIGFTYSFFLSKPGDTVLWGCGIAAVIGAVICHLGGNLVSDYYDYLKHVDRKGTFGSSRMLVDGIFKPKTILWYGITLLAIGSVIGIILCFISGIQLLWIGILGILLTYFYSFLKYHALGDLCIFIIFGLLVALGTSYSMLSVIDPRVLAVSTPIGLLVVNILHANNSRDIRDDGKADITTQAMLLGIKGSKIKYVTYVVLAYIGILACCIFGLLTWFALIVLLSLPLAIRNIRKMLTFESSDKPEAILGLDGMSAQLVVAFGLLQVIGIMVGLFV